MKMSTNEIFLPPPSLAPSLPEPAWRERLGALGGGRGRADRGGGLLSAGQAPAVLRVLVKKVIGVATVIDLVIRLLIVREILIRHFLLFRTLFTRWFLLSPFRITAIADKLNLVIFILVEQKIGLIAKNIE